MRFAFVCLLVLACCMDAAHAGQAVRSYRADIALEVDTQGHVIKATPSDELPQSLVAPVQEIVARWRFQPVQRNGAAVTARTYARVMVELVPQGTDNYGLQVKYLSNGPSLIFTSMPAYPAPMMRGRAEGTVYMQAVVQPDGSVTDIRLQDFKSTGGTVGTTRHTAEVFARAAQGAMEKMQAKPEWVDGKPVATTFILPITFSLNGGSSMGVATGSAAGAASSTTD